ncbi:MAG: J domain-containing protein, partial [Hymenobacteraceae bacterium]|nr:J domain-containing protein [Hymenobacteraceae bacterium]
MPHAPDPEEDDLEFDEEATAAEDELVMEGDEGADDWFADGDDLGAGDDGADDD